MEKRLFASSRIRNLTLIVLMCSFLAALLCPHSFLYSHWPMYQTLFGVGMMLNGGGTVPPSSK